MALINGHGLATTKHTYGVWCIVSGGRTGSRAAWLKVAGQVRTFPTREAAAAEANCLQANVSPFGHCMFSYTAREMD
jgi:hypothetical protein